MCDVYVVCKSCVLAMAMVGLVRVRVAGGGCCCCG